VFSDITSVLKKLTPSLASTHGDSKLGEVKDFGSLVQMAQEQGVPLTEVKGATADQKDQARSVFAEIAKKIIEKTKSKTT